MAVPTADQEVLAAYQAYYETIYSLGSPTPQQIRAAFEPYAEPHVVENWVKVFASFAVDDRRPSGAVTFGPIQVTVAGESATVYECRDGTSETMTRVSSGEVLSHGSPGTLVDSKLNHGADGKWRVASSAVKPGSC